MAQQRIGQRHRVEQLISPAESSMGSSIGIRMLKLERKMVRKSGLYCRAQRDVDFKGVLKEKWLRADFYLDFNWFRFGFAHRGLGVYGPEGLRLPDPY